MMNKDEYIIGTRVNNSNVSYLAPFPRYGGLFAKFSVLAVRYLSLMHSFGMNS